MTRVLTEEQREAKRQYNRAYSRKRYEADPEAARDRELKRLYGITGADYDERLRQQDFRCAVCLSDTPGGKGRFHVDHCHTTGRVRGLLCSQCNRGLGLFKDKADVLKRASEYLCPN